MRLGGSIRLVHGAQAPLPEAVRPLLLQGESTIITAKTAVR